ncbi:C-terminal binding protein [Basfia succiniciproducens]|uniref:C-terminal binding protein n=1 Tax=Basfia succiniciproducens TaxID=653940 RepID=UPI0008D0CBAA|nr:C-terminal binding protein [Basfia succiniciproducens]SEQ09221.1 D-3-phosphoglycerate dehydrogenase [Basfia succiniciproducens]
MKKIVVIEPGYLNYEEEKRVLAKYDAEFVVIPLGSSQTKIIKEIQDADAIMVREAKVNAELISMAAQCKVIVRYGVGVDNIDLAAAKKKGIYVANVPDYGSIDVAEHAIALLFAITRRIVKRDVDVRKGKWGIGQLEPMYRIEGKTLGLIGFGRIAREFFRKTRGIGFTQVLVSDPVLTNEEAKQLGIKKVEIDELCQQADFISLHAPLLPQTHHLINARRLTLMKPTTALVNCGRGGLIDETALYQTLKANRLFAAGLDTFEQEPVSPNNPLLKLDNVICSDHTAWYTAESVIELQHKAALEVLRVFDGEQPKNWVNK